MKILYLGYWPSGDGLTQSVIVPRLEMLSRFQKVKEIVFCSVERGDSEPLTVTIPKVTQLFFRSEQKSNVFFTKLSDFREWYLMMKDCIRQKEISLLVCNSPLAGIIGYYLNMKMKVPYVVECFEPHATYMLEAGAWRFWDPRYLALTFYEWRQRKTAFKLATVSPAYSAKLLMEGVPSSKIVMVPNCIALEKFEFKPERRSAKRSELGIDEKDLAGIYVGKFGDIYYDEEAFDLFAEAFHFFGEKFWLVILTPASPNVIFQKMKRRNISEKHIVVAHVSRESVPGFLSASDFAFSTIRPSPSRVYCCPIKNGEYWANGLPILLEDGIGEDSAIIRKEGGGVILAQGESAAAFARLSELMKKGRAEYAMAVSSIAVRHRRMEFLSDYYRDLIDQRGL